MLVMDADSFSDAKWQTLLANTFSRQNNQVKHNFRRWCHQTPPKLQSWLLLKPETLSTWRAAYAPPHSPGKTPQELQDTKLWNSLGRSSRFSNVGFKMVFNCLKKIAASSDGGRKRGPGAYRSSTYGGLSVTGRGKCQKQECVRSKSLSIRRVVHLTERRLLANGWW